MEWPIGNPWILLAAALLDVAIGDPPNRIHPVAAMGTLITTMRMWSPTQGRLKPLLAGLSIIALGLALCLAIAFGVSMLRDGFPWVGLIVEVIVLKSMFSVRGLASAALEVRRNLVSGDLAEARRLLSWHLVSRDTANLDEVRVAAAAIESVAENASDGVIAPWLFYLLGGVPGALIYRFVNTADALLGYRDAEREWLGKIPARFDDILNLVPARLTAAGILLVAPFVGGRWLPALQIWWRDARKTASPNAGHPMSAAAGVLSIELEKVGAYKLGAGSRLPEAADIGRAVGLLWAVGGIALVLVLAGSELLRYCPW